MHICNNKNSNMQQKNILFPSYSWVLYPFLIFLCFSVHGCSWYVLLSIRCRYVSFFPFLAVWKSRKIISQFLNEHRQSHLDKMSSFLFTGSVYLSKETDRRKRKRRRVDVYYLWYYLLYSFSYVVLMPRKHQALVEFEVG